MGFQGGASGKEPTCLCRRCTRRTFNPWVANIPWRRAWKPTPVFLPGESHGQRSLVGTVHGVAKSDTTEGLINTAQPNYKVFILSHSASQSSHLWLFLLGPERQQELCLVPHCVLLPDLTLGLCKITLQGTSSYTKYFDILKSSPLDIFPKMDYWAKERY